MKKTKLLALATLSFATCLTAGTYLATETTVAEEVTPNLEIVGHTLSLENDVHIKYAVNAENLENGDTLKLKINDKEVLDVTGTVTNGENTYYTFEYTGLSAKQMTDNVYAEVFVDRGTTTYTSDKDKYSILEYAYGKLGKTNAEATLDAELKTLLNDMLSYGASAQRYFNYNTNKLATDDFLYVTLQNATFEDGFSYDFLKVGQSVKVILKDGMQMDEAFAEYVEQNANGELILTIPAEHVWSTTYSYDKTYHWYDCGTCNGVKDKEEHTENENGECAVCGMLMAETEGLIYDISADGTYAEVIGYEGTATKIRIADAYQGLPVKSIYDKAFYHNDNIVSVIIPDTVETIGDEAFYNCYSLTSVVIGDSVTSIGNYAFWDCSGLTSVVIPDSVTSIGNSAFYSCNRLMSVIIGDSLTTMGNRVFGNCYDLTSIVIPNSITSIVSETFYNCYSLTSIVIPDSVTSIGSEAFRYCDSLASLEIPDSVTRIDGYAFSDCRKLTSIKVDENNTTYKDIDGNLYSKDGKTLIQYAIGKKENSFMIPNSVTSIEYYAFYSCSNLTNIEIPNSIEIIESATFESCSNLYFYEYANCKYLGNKENPYLVLVGVKGKNFSNYIIHEDTKVIAGAAFYNCTRMGSIVIPDSVTTIGNHAFADCDGLTDMVIPNSVTLMGDWVFAACDNLTNVIIPNSVISIGEYAFGVCTKVTVYCEAESQPSGWDDSWYWCNTEHNNGTYSCTVVWGYKGEIKNEDLC